MPLLLVGAAVLLWQGWRAARDGIDFRSTPLNGVGSGIVLGGAATAIMMAMLALAPVLSNLPEMTADGLLEPPNWLNDYHWAKPAIMLMGLWSAIGSSNMLLYIAALGNVPQELYEAADIDGASRFQRFWHVTWPQLAPTTFFIVVMSVIGGLQGGFETARTMTKGGPAGATTTLAYFIYQEGFETGRLGYASAVAWTLFAMVFVVTLFNLKFGSRYVND
jgi:multiple sugar transport system permease protein